MSSAGRERVDRGHVLSRVTGRLSSRLGAEDADGPATSRRGITTGSSRRLRASRIRQSVLDVAGSLSSGRRALGARIRRLPVDELANRALSRPRRSSAACPRIVRSSVVVVRLGLRWRLLPCGIWSATSSFARARYSIAGSPCQTGSARRCRRAAGRPTSAPFRRRRSRSSSAGSTAWPACPTRGSISPLDDIVGPLPVDVRHQADDAVHVRGPDRDAGVAAGEADAVAVVEADPDQRQDARRVADEPRVAIVARRAGLAGERALEAERRAPSRRCRS